MIKNCYNMRNHSKTRLVQKINIEALLPQCVFKRLPQLTVVYYTQYVTTFPSK